jgi:hypothetical protein
MSAAALGVRYQSSRQDALVLGISVFAQLEQARRHARRYSLGAFVAEIELAPDIEIRRTRRRTAGHFTVWADPDELRERVQRVLRVD